MRHHRTSTNATLVNHAGFLQAVDIKRPNLDTDGDGVIDEISAANGGAAPWFETIGGGTLNIIGSNVFYATIPGGSGCRVSNNVTVAFAAGSEAVAGHHGTFIWGDSTHGIIGSSAEDEVTFRANGGFRIFSGAGVGVRLAPGATSWSAMSDKHIKENVRPVDPRDVLSRLAQMPISTWNAKSQDPSIRHMGPMAQDFRAAFALGEDERYINASDADGVALTAIQGLYQMLQEKDAALAAQAAQIADLRREIEALKEQVK